MKKVLVLILALILFHWTACKLNEEKIEFGSNNGKHLTILDTKIYYEEYGEGMPLILLQGAMGSIKDFEKFIPGLSKEFRIIAPDTPGQGRSELADSMSYQLLTEYISQLIDFLIIDSAYVMGWSDGGIVGVLLADKRPDKVKRVLAAGANYKLEGFIIPPDVNLGSKKPLPIAEWEAQSKDWIENYVRMLPGIGRNLRMTLIK